MFRHAVLNVFGQNKNKLSEHVYSLHFDVLDECELVFITTQFDVLFLKKNYPYDVSDASKLTDSFST